ncbi:tRNA glutamyl-Q(34) synthetase GluQRS [Thioalkalivibrio sp. ALJ7]|uniref:tRNA glutamyl-Q(34) synthetase GluQRS n=1 Tax=Thioalkalivibrio sp. ALJ7 TaxID=1158756 RepID=UPI0004770F8A|nr:tRNA glutamyl-Q(34) synthetase GluQRS [Thioalkalivibrio sp. ALJ7]
MTPSHRNDSGYVGRFAPTPSGPLHAGSLLAAVVSWLDARHHGGRWHLRIDDIDGPRVRPAAESLILQTLEALALCWDGPLTHQSDRTPAYEAALDTLLNGDHAFACACSRRDLTATGQPGWEGPVYPGTCRNGLPAGREARAVRARARQRYWEVEDGFLGLVSFDLEALGSDFVIRRADGIFAYQLATVVDDLKLGITHVVRGIDLLGSTPRQLQLYQALGHTGPRHAHHPVLVAGDGAKLAKATGAVGVRTDAVRQELAAILTRIGLAPSDPSTPDTPEQQLSEALSRLRDSGLRDLLLLSATLPVGPDRR